MTSAGLGYSYDTAGRLIQTVNASITTNYGYDNAGQLLSTAVAGGATTNYGYDAAGRRITDGSASLTWDQQDRLLTYGSGNSYAYNATGLRVSKTVTGQIEAFVWDTAEGLPLLLQDGSTSYVTGAGGLPLEQVSGSTVFYYQQDQLGSTRTLTDATGTTAATYSYDAFGNLTAQTGSVSNPFLFTGQYRDAESGLYYLRARYYNSATGQFISRDPELSSTGEPYGYAANNPLNLTDPSGLCFGFGPSSNGICDFVRDNATSAAHAVISWIGSEMNTPEGRLLSGMWSGYSFSLSWSDNPFFIAGEVVGLVFAVCTLDPMGGALNALRLGGGVAKFAKEGELAAEGAGMVFQGGRYGKLATGDGIERHHLIADAISSYTHSQGPAIQMEMLDHWATARWGTDGEAYRLAQKALVDRGDTAGAFWMDIQDIQSKFGSKYDEAIMQALRSLGR